MERWHAKLIALLIIFVVTLIATLLPIKVSSYFIKHGQKGQRVLSCLMCFGGGVFLSVYMLHMMPDMMEVMEEALLKPYNIAYPLAEFIVGCGFFMMVFTEYAAHAMQTSSIKKKKVLISSETSADVIATRLSSTESLHGNGNAKIFMDEQREKEVLMMETVITDGKEEEVKEEEEVEAQAGHSHAVNMQSTRSLLLLLALSLHHIFEGISVGLKDSQASVWSMCIAIVSHEVVIAFSLGLQLTKTYNNPMKVAIAGTVCSLMVPVGVALGMSIMETGGQGNSAIDIANGVLQGISTGVFIYITFFEILAEEMTLGELDLTKLLFMLFGYLLMAALGLIPENEEGAAQLISNCTCPGDH